MANRTGWFNDPAGRHRLRYRNEEWTPWVFDGPEPTVDPDGVEYIDRRRRRRIVAGVVGAVAGALFLVMCLMYVDRALRSEESRGVDEAIAEMDDWLLPPDVRHPAGADHVEGGSIGAYGPTVTRWYRAADGTSLADALQALADSLERQGYDLVRGSDGSSDPGTTWAGTLKSSKYADFTLGPDVDGKRIAVVVHPD